MATPKISTSRIDLPLDTRRAMIALLNQQLADTIDLYSQTKQAHWNVKGSHFYPLHELYDKLAKMLEGFIDMIAERATALGGTALGTVRMASSASRLPEFSQDAIDGLASVEALAERFAGLSTSVRAAIDNAQKDDPGTTDLFTEMSRELDKALWFLESHLQT